MTTQYSHRTKKNILSLLIVQLNNSARVIFFLARCARSNERSVPEIKFLRSSQSSQKITTSYFKTSNSTKILIVIS